MRWTADPLRHLFSPHGKAIQRFTTSSTAIRDELRRSIPARLLAGRTFDAYTESGQIGLLKRQLDRKRGGMSVRALMDNFGELITQILPCTLMSPDSVARFFPAQADIFDIVVFDEASQIRVADAIGAMGRAKSVVMVGDSKQMPPTIFAEANAAVDEGEEDANPEVVADEESILSECVQSLVPQQWLSWHYRSQDEALIASSNIHYYNGRLASFPAPLAPNSGHGISLVRVDGHFERSGRGKTLRTNRVEADRIVADIRTRFAASPDAAPSIGVITFNAQQRDLIENLLRDAGDDRLVQALDEPDGLFVKNLENVQGDERDTILFSVAFSKNDKGVVPLNFGPLSRPGGERRLNVAITRARCEVVLYASFDPAELRAEETTQVGTKHLRAYLEMAQRGVQTITQAAGAMR
jgi:superfamily I DNA and/or RNA helicase